MTPDQSTALDACAATLAALVDELLLASPQDALSLPIHVFSGYLTYITANRELDPENALRVARSILGDTHFVMSGEYFERTDRADALWERYRDAQHAARAIPNPPMLIEPLRGETLHPQN